MYYLIALTFVNIVSKCMISYIAMYKKILTNTTNRKQKNKQKKIQTKKFFEEVTGPICSSLWGGWYGCICNYKIVSFETKICYVYNILCTQIAKTAKKLCFITYFVLNIP